VQRWGGDCGEIWEGGVMTKLKPSRTKSPAQLSNDMSNSCSAMLTSAITKQKKKVLSALVRLQNVHEETKPKTKTAPFSKPVLFKFESFEENSDIQKQFSEVYGGAGDGHKVASLNCYVRGMTYLDKSLESIKLGQFEIALNQFALALESTGSADAFASNNQFVSVQAKIKADVSSKPKIAMRKKVTEYWKVNISPTLSAPKAADLMLGMPSFKWQNNEEVSHKFLAECVRAEKKRVAAAKRI
jgi:hypothetical protein